MTQFEELAAGARELHVEILHGDIDVQGDEGEHWTLTWSSDRGEEPELRRDGDVVRVTQRHHPVNPPRLNLKLVTPTPTQQVRLQTRHGRATIQRIQGEVHAETGHGDIVARATNGPLDLKTGAGRVETHETEGDLRARSGHGDVLVRAVRGDTHLNTAAGRVQVMDAHGNLEAQSGHGDIVVREAPGEITLRTGAGRIEVAPAPTASIRAQTGHGDIHVGEGAVQALHLDTRAGRVTCLAVLAPGKHEITSGNGDIALKAVRGEVHVETANGRIEIGEGQGALRARSGHGDILLRASHGEASLTSNSGRVEVHEADGELKAETGHGDILLRQAGGQAALRTNAGRIEVMDARALGLHARSGHGDVRVREGSLQSMNIHTGNGRVDCTVELQTGKHEVGSGNGDIRLQVRPRGHIQFDAHTNSGQVHSDFPLVRVGRQGSTGLNAVRMVGSTGSGEAGIFVVVRTGRGRIELRRLEGGAQPAQVDADRHAAVGATVPLNESADNRTLAVLQALARGDISVEEANHLL